MATKIITIPFDLERAKKIQEGKEEGRITTKSNEKVRIVCWDLKDNVYSLIALVYNEKTKEESCLRYKVNGHFFSNNSKSSMDLVLQVPEYTQYKDGDILVSSNGKCPFIFKGISGDYYDYYIGINTSNNLMFSIPGQWCPITSLVTYANEEQKQQLINALQDSKEPIAKEFLKRFFNIEKEEFKPFDKVLVREDKKNIWIAAFFSHYIEENPYSYITTGDLAYSECIPYNEETKHLLGTSKNWENKQ